MKQHILFLLLFVVTLSQAQGSAMGVKGGLTVGQQNWNNSGTYNNSLLFRYHGDAFIESISESSSQSVLFGQIGYHIRGSAFRYRSGVGVGVDGNPVSFPGYTQAFQFKNVVLVLGAKRRGVLGSEKAYYTVGIRGEYTVGTNFNNLSSSLISYTYPQKEFVKNLQYGLSIGGGYEFPFSELVGGFIELNIQPDLSKQYYRPAFNAYDPFSRQNIIVSEQTIRNISIELSLGFRFLRKIEYTN